MTEIMNASWARHRRMHVNGRGRMTDNDLFELVQKEIYKAIKLDGNMVRLELHIDEVEKSQLKGLKRILKNLGYKYVNYKRDSDRIWVVWFYF